MGNTESEFSVSMDGGVAADEPIPAQDVSRQSHPSAPSPSSSLAARMGPKNPNQAIRKRPRRPPPQQRPPAKHVLSNSTAHMVLRGAVVGMRGVGKRTLLQRLQGEEPSFSKRVDESTDSARPEENFEVREAYSITAPYQPPMLQNNNSSSTTTDATLPAQRITLSVTACDRLTDLSLDEASPSREAFDFVVVLLHPHHSATDVEAHLRQTLHEFLQRQGYHTVEQQKQQQRNENGGREAIHTVPPQRPVCLCLVLNFQDLLHKRKDSRKSKNGSKAPPKSVLPQADVMAWTLEVLAEYPMLNSNKGLLLLQWIPTSLWNCYGLSVLHAWMYRTYLARRDYQVRQQLYQLQTELIPTSHRYLQDQVADQLDYLQYSKQYKKLLVEEKSTEKQNANGKPEGRSSYDPMSSNQLSREKQQGIPPPQSPPKAKSEQVTHATVPNGNKSLSMETQSRPMPPQQKPQPMTRDATTATTTSLEDFLASDDDDDERTNQLPATSNYGGADEDEDDDEFFVGTGDDLTRRTGIPPMAQPSTPLSIPIVPGVVAQELSPNARVKSDPVRSSTSVREVVAASIAVDETPEQPLERDDEPEKFLNKPTKMDAFAKKNDSTESSTRQSTQKGNVEEKPDVQPTQLTSTTEAVVAGENSTSEKPSTVDDETLNQPAASHQSPSASPVAEPRISKPQEPVPDPLVARVRENDESDDAFYADVPETGNTSVVVSPQRSTAEDYDDDDEDDEFFIGEASPSSLEKKQQEIPQVSKAALNTTTSPKSQESPSDTGLSAAALAAIAAAQQEAELMFQQSSSSTVAKKKKKKDDAGKKKKKKVAKASPS